jgi:hypothetical protein
VRDRLRLCRKPSIDIRHRMNRGHPHAIGVEGSSWTRASLAVAGRSVCAMSAKAISGPRNRRSRWYTFSESYEPATRKNGR